MACETRHCRGRSSRRFFTRRHQRCRRHPGDGSVRHDGVGRYYDPHTGQFLSVDPLVDETEQAYAYAGGDPVNLSDQLGLCPHLICGTLHDIVSGFDALNNVANSGVDWAATRFNASVCGWFQGSSGLLSGWIEEQAGCGFGSTASVASSNQSLTCSLAVGGLKSGSTADEARTAANDSGYHIPSDYIARPADNGKGWVFSPSGAQDDESVIRVMEPTARYPDGYVRTYNSQGYPTDAQGNQIGSKGVGQDETHFPLPPDDVPFEG
ncbi:MAG: RHS repeat-associated core domain-containing protein [Acidimicrobiales bacterium]